MTIRPAFIGGYLKKRLTGPFTATIKCKNLAKSEIFSEISYASILLPFKRAYITRFYLNQHRSLARSAYFIPVLPDPDRFRLDVSLFLPQKTYFFLYGPLALRVSSTRLFFHGGSSRRIMAMSLSIRLLLTGIATTPVSEYIGYDRLERQVLYIRLDEAGRSLSSPPFLYVHDETPFTVFGNHRSSYRNSGAIWTVPSDLVAADPCVEGYPYRSVPFVRKRTGGIRLLFLK
jgi:hypothetical protein